MNNDYELLLDEEQLEMLFGGEWGELQDMYDAYWSNEGLDYEPGKDKEETFLSWIAPKCAKKIEQLTLELANWNEYKTLWDNNPDEVITANLDAVVSNYWHEKVGFTPIIFTVEFNNTHYIGDADIDYNYKISQSKI